MPELAQRQRDQIRTLKALPDEQIDLEEAPEAVDWSNAVRGKYHQPDGAMPIRGHRPTGLDEGEIGVHGSAQPISGRL